MAASELTVSELTVEVTDDVDDIDPAEWDGVVDRAGAPVFYSHAFVSAYHHAPLASIEGYAYLIVRRRRDGAAVAVVPAYLQHRPDPIGCLTAAYPDVDGPALLSHVWHCYDGRLPTTVEHECLIPVVVDTLRSTARRFGARWCGLVNVERDGITGKAMQAAGLPLRHLVDRFTMQLSGLHDFDDYLARLSHDTRHTLRRHLRRASDAAVITEVLTVREARLDEVAELSARTAARFGNVQFYRQDTFGTFVRSLGDGARVIEVRQRGRLVAAAVCLLDAQRFHAWTGGVDYEVDGKFSPYRVMHAALVSLALRLRAPILEGGRSNADFKRRHGMNPRPLDAMVVPA